MEEETEMVEHGIAEGGAIAKYSILECGCRIDIVIPDGNWAWTHCPLHDAAPELLDACREALETAQWYQDNGLSGRDYDIRLFKAAIARAEGQNKPQMRHE